LVVALCEDATVIRERTSAKFFAVDGVAIVVINALTLVVALRVLLLRKVGHVIKSPNSR